MAASRHPGSLGAQGNNPVIAPGTLASVASPLPGPIGQHAIAQPAPTVDMPAEDAEIDALDLAPTARNAAYALKKAHPTVKFTSGRRDKAAQARAMASNVMSNRKWIEQTYKKKPPCARNARIGWTLIQAKKPRRKLRKACCRYSMKRAMKNWAH